MTLKQTRYLIYALAVCIVFSAILAMLFPQAVTIFLLSFAFFSIALVTVNRIFWRCPHCGSQLGRDIGRFCQHCGMELPQDT